MKLYKLINFKSFIRTNSIYDLNTTVIEYILSVVVDFSIVLRGTTISGAWPAGDA